MEQEQIAALTAERDRYRMLFTALVAESVGRSDGAHVPGLVRISWQAVAAVEDLTLVEWPMVEDSYDFSVYRKGAEPARQTRQ